MKAVTKYHIDTKLYDGDTGLTFDTRKEAEDWIQKVGRPFEIKEVIGYMVKKSVRNGLLTEKEVEVFQQIPTKEC